jgi:hypothetical protein
LTGARQAVERVLTAEHSPDLFALLTSTVPGLLSFLLFGDLIEKLFHCHVFFGSLTTTPIKRRQLHCDVLLSTIVVEPTCYIHLENEILFSVGIDDLS